MEEITKLTAIKIMCCDNTKLGLKRSKLFLNDLNKSFDKFYMEDTFLNEFAIELKKNNQIKRKLKLF